MSDLVIEAKELTKTYKMGDVEVHALRGLSTADIARGRGGCHHGPFRIG